MSKRDLTESAHLYASQALELANIMHSLPAEPLPPEQRARCNFVTSEACWLLLGLACEKMVEVTAYLNKLLESEEHPDERDKNL